jgi:hypothetical protein
VWGDDPVHLEGGTGEVRLVCERPLTPADEAGWSEVIRGVLGFPFALRFTCFTDRLPGTAGGKFEECVCRLPREAVRSPAGSHSEERPVAV